MWGSTVGGSPAPRVGRIKPQQAYHEAFDKPSESERRALAERYLEAARDDSRPYHGYEQGQDLDRASSPRELGRMTRKAAQ